MTTPTRIPAWQLWTEKQWLEEVRKMAHMLGWITYHPHQSMRSEPGFPDLVLCRERVLFVELKRHSPLAKLSLHQQLWRDRLLEAGAEHYVWRPGDADQIIRILGRKR